MCYTDKVGSSYYIRQKTSSDGITWSSPSNVVQVNSGTGNPALLQADDGTIYLAYRKGNNYIYVLSNSGSGWSSPVQTTGIADGDCALLESDSEIVIIYKGTDEYCYRISSSDGITWSAPSQIAPNKALTDPATVDRKDVFYRVTSQQISASALDTVKVTEFSYGGDDYLARSTDVLISEDQTLKSSMHFGYDSKGRVVERIARDENGTQTEKIIYTYNNKNKVIRQDVYAGISTDISYSVITAYDNKGNVIYTRNPEGAEHYYSYANTDCENQFTGIGADLHCHWIECHCTRFEYRYYPVQTLWYFRHYRDQGVERMIEAQAPILMVLLPLTAAFLTPLMGLISKRIRDFIPF